MLTPREYTGRTSRRAPPRSIKALDTYVDDDAPDDVIINQLTDLPDDLYLTVCSLVAANAGSRSCSLCGKTDHLLASCSWLDSILKDPSRARRILSTLEQHAKSRGGSPSTSTPPSHSSSSSRPSNATPPRRNIRSLDTDTDEDATVASLTEDCPTDNEEEPDFH